MTTKPRFFIEALDPDLLRLSIDRKDFVLDYDTSFEILMQLATIISRMEEADPDCEYSRLQIC